MKMLWIEKNSFANDTWKNVSKKCLGIIVWSNEYNLNSMAQLIDIMALTGQL